MADPYRTGTKTGWQRFAANLEAAFVFPKGRGRLTRPRYGRKLAGVCAGLAGYYGWDATLLRVLVVVLAVMSSGLIALAYAAAWVLIPEGQYSLVETTTTGDRTTPS